MAKKMMIKAANPAMTLIREVRETCDLNEVAALLSSGCWIAIAAAQNSDGTYLFVLGYVPWP